MSPPQAFRRGRFYSGRPGATALVAQDGVITFVGDDAGAMERTGGMAVDLGGRLVTPAFVDAHVHLIQTGQKMAGIDLGVAGSRDDVLRLVSGYAASHPEARVIVGQGWDERRWPDPRPPLRAEIDRASGGVAVYLARVDVHSAVVSTALLERLPGISHAAGYSPEGLLSRDAHHRCRVQMDSLFSDAERRELARAALQRAASVGIAAVHELGGPHLGPIEDLVRIGEVARDVGVEVVSYWGELATPEVIATALGAGAVGLAGDLCVDGSIGSRTAALVAPYADSPTRGARYLSTAEITDHVIACTKAHLQAGFHCIGDDAVGATVEGFRRAAATVGEGAIRAARHRLEHVEMIAEADLPTLARLGVVASMQPAFDAAWGSPGELYEQRLAGRFTTMNRVGTIHRSGVPLAFGSDTPVTPLAGWETVRAAVRHHQPAERLDPRSAFDAATRDAYWAARDDHAGTLSVGSRASFAVWDSPGEGAPRSAGQGPDEVSLPVLADDTPVPNCLLTVAGGRVIFDSGALSR